MSKLLPIFFGFVVCTSAVAEVVGIQKAQLNFQVATRSIVELAAANAKLGKRYSSDVAQSGKPNYHEAYVSSIIGSDKRKYIFVGFPIAQGVFHESIIQYCDQLDMYVFEQYGAVDKSVEEGFEAFVHSNNTALFGLNDLCGAIYKLNSE